MMWLRQSRKLLLRPGARRLFPPEWASLSKNGEHRRDAFRFLWRRTLRAWGGANWRHFDHDRNQGRKRPVLCRGVIFDGIRILHSAHGHRGFRISRVDVLAARMLHRETQGLDHGLWAAQVKHDLVGPPQDPDDGLPGRGESLNRVRQLQFSVPSWPDVRERGEDVLREDVDRHDRE